MTNYPSRLLAQTSAPAAEPITLAEAKLYLRVDADDDDALITALIAAARMHAEQYLAKSLINQSWKIAFNDELACETPLPMGPISSITSITAYDRDEEATIISTDAYYLDAARDALVLDAAIASHRVEVFYVAGYGASGSSVPPPIRQGIMAHIGLLYDGRSKVEGALPEETVRLYAPYREVRV